MREIKFRFWNGERMWYKDDLTIDGNHFNITFFGGPGKIPWGAYDSVHENRIATGDPDAIINSPSILMQFTGLKDRNGKEIYEGDILSDWTETDEGRVQSKNQVFWNEHTGGWHLDNSSEQDKTCSTELWLELNDFEYEVTGNIHQNPELLKR